MKKRIVFLDMDGVLADFDGALKGIISDPPEMFIQGFFRNLKPMSGAKEGVELLLANTGLEVYVGSKPSTVNTYSATEKLDWLAEHFPALLKRVVLVCDKALLRGDVLVDDDANLWGHKFVGEFIHFDKLNPKESWSTVIKKLIPDTTGMKA